MKIVFLNRSLVGGGIEKCIELLSREINKDYEIEIVYVDDSILDPNMIPILSKYGKVYKLDEKIVECDVCIWCHLYIDYENIKKQIKTTKNICWIHSMPRIAPNCLLDNPVFFSDMDEFICVSEAVKNNLNIAKEGKVIHNFMASDIIPLSEEFNPFEGLDNDVLKLAVISRISHAKGFGRLLLLANTLKDRNIKFNIKIAGKGIKQEQEIRDSFANFNEVEFVGYKENPYPYVKNADYLVQLSDDESWCNSITEAKILGTPVIVTNFESSKEQVTNLENGIIIDLNETDYNKYIDDIMNNKDKLRANLKDFTHKNDVEAWLKIFNN